MRLFWELHAGLAREGPGSNLATADALRRIGEYPRPPRILDIGCGPGMQTIELAKLTGGHVTAVDRHQPFLDELGRRALREGVSVQVRTWKGSMTELPFPDESFDLIWSEGAIYVMGFENGLTSWMRLLKPHGALAVTEISWLDDVVVKEPRRFWHEHYPAMTTVEKNLAAIRSAGYQVVDHFTLPASAWWDEYYRPLERRMRELRHKYQGDAAALTLLDGEQKEIDLYRRYPTSYGYVFYLMRRPD